MQLFEHKLAREGYRQEYKQHHMQARNQDELRPERLLAGFVAQLEFQNEVQHPRLDMISGRLEKPEECCSGNISSFEL